MDIAVEAACCADDGRRDATNTFKGRRIFAAALLATGAALVNGAVILAPAASAEKPDPNAAKQALVDACIKTAESISVPGHSSTQIFVGCCNAYGGVVVQIIGGGLICDFAGAVPPPLRPAGSPAAGPLPTDATHI